ncbi:MAG: putative Sulfate-transporting ATPase [Frankiales bacterium]|nr:putative Sulfate-transporting ATPase [Frankiales bacterium]
MSWLTDLLPFIIGGLAGGSIYAMAALGLVLTYKTTGIFNFAHGSVAAVAAYVFYDLREKHGMPWPIALLLVVGVLGPIMGLLLERLARPLSRVSTAGKIVATVGLLVGIQGALSMHYGSVALEFPAFLPTNTYNLGSVIISADQIITMMIALVAAGGLAAFFRSTRTGRAMRAVVDNGDLLGLTGISPTRVRVTSWVIGSCFASLSGLLIAPSLGLDSFLLTLLVVQAFGAAAIGGFGSLPLCYVGGLVVGIGASVSKKYVGDFPALAGFPNSLPFLVLFAVLLVLPSRRLTQVPDAPQRPKRVSAPLPRSVVGALVTAGLAVVLLLPLFARTKLPTMTNAVIFVLVFASLALLVQTSGQVSLCHITFAAVGATTYSHLSDSGAPWIVSLLGAGLVAVPVGAIVAIPAIRLSRLYLALATLGFGILVERLFYSRDLMFGSLGTRQVSRPGFAEGNDAYFYLSVAVVLVGLAIVFTVNRARLGRLLRAMSDSPTALATLGVDVNTARLLVLCVSAFLAGISGALLAGANTSISSIGFNSLISLQLLPILYLAGTSQLLAPVIAAFSYAVLPAFFSGDTFIQLQPILFGAAAVTVAALSGRKDSGDAVARLAERARARTGRSVLAHRLARSAA